MSDRDYWERLEKPDLPIDLLIDTDAYNQVDDLYALAYVLRSPERFHLQAITAAPFYSPKELGRLRQNESPREGMEASFAAIGRLLQVMEKEKTFAGKVFKGSEAFLPAETTPVPSPAADEIVRLARLYSPEKPLYIVAIGALTNVASAFLQAPDIADKLVLVWLGGHGHETGKCDDFNARQDIAAVRVAFAAGAALVQLPCNGVGTDFAISRAELEERLRGRNRLCDYLWQETFNLMNREDPALNWSKPLWDVLPFARLADKRFTEERTVPSPLFGYDLNYEAEDPARKKVQYVYKIHRDLIYEDLFARLYRAE